MFGDITKYIWLGEESRDKNFALDRSIGSSNIIKINERNL